jgi:hypothetical protein
MATTDPDVTFGLAGLVMAASLMEALRKRGFLDEEGTTEVMANALVYMQAFGVEHPPEVEEQTRRLLEMVSRAAGQAPQGPAQTAAD